MKTMLLAAAAGLGLAASTAAYADSGEGIEPNTFFTGLPGVVAQAPAQNVPSIADQQGQQRQTFSQSGRGPWLFPPISNYLDQQAGG